MLNGHQIGMESLLESVDELAMSRGPLINKYNNLTNQLSKIKEQCVKLSDDLGKEKDFITNFESNREMLQLQKDSLKNRNDK